MKSFIPVTCSCGQELTIEASGTKPVEDAQCPQCHSALWFVEGLADFVGVRILQRALIELKNEDWTLVIVLGAMAIECEMARLFVKWNAIDFGMANTSDATAEQKEKWAKQWSTWTRIKLRLDKLSELMTKADFDCFLSSKPALLKAVHEKYPALKAYTSQKDFLQKEFFNRRNRIVHFGQIDFQQNDAEMCATIALTLFQILKAMDAERYDKTFGVAKNQP